VSERVEQLERSPGSDTAAHIDLVEEVHGRTLGESAAQPPPTPRSFAS
jgi:hypothetical protein